MFVANLTRSVARPAVASLVRRAVAAPTVRCTSKLAAVLRREVAEERPLSEMDEGLKSMVEDLKSKGMMIKDEPGQSVVRLFGPGVGTEKVMVEFDCQEEGDGDEDWPQEGEDGEEGEAKELSTELEGEEEEDLEGADAGFRFLATVTKGPKKLVFAGTATSRISLAAVSHCPSNVDHHDSSLYRGPHFEELDPEVQEAMKHYLEERNVGDDMAAFICMYADYKEQTEYVNWLEEVENFIK